MRGNLRKLILPAVLTLLALTLLMSLGNWQVRRLAWKEDLIARVAARPEMPPLDFRHTSLVETGDLESFLERSEYRPILLTGEYLPAKEVLAFTSLESPRGQAGGPGYWVMTPFAAPDGAIVLVNRGFVPDGREDDYAPPPAGEQTVEGLIRAPETGSRFTPDPDTERRVFFARDPSRIGDTVDLSADLPPRRPGVSYFMRFFVDLDASFTPPSGLPQAGETRMSFPNNHLQYAVTWYGLAAALLAIFAVFAWRSFKEPQAGP